MEIVEKRLTMKDGTVVQVYITGHGEPLLFLHGNGQDSHIFKKHLPYFKANYQCILLDARSHGKSEKSKSPLTFSLMAEDAYEVLQQLHINKADVIGYSDGSNVAMVLAVKHPLNIQKLVLNAGNLTVEGSTNFSRFLEKAYILLGTILRWDIEVLHLLSQNTGLKMSDLQTISAHTLVLVGQFDFIKSKHTENIAAHIPNSELIVAKWASHFMIRFQPKRYSKIIDQFFQSETQGGRYA